MPRLTLRSAFLVLSLTCASALAQNSDSHDTTTQQTPAPVERAPLSVAVPHVDTGVSAWPISGSIKPGTHLLITTFVGQPNAYNCKLLAIETDRITCAGHHTKTTTFDRPAVESILMAPRRQFLVSTILFAAGGTVLLVDLMVARAGSTGGAVGGSALVGLYVLIAGSIARGIEQYRGPGVPVPIYITPARYAPY